MCKNCDGEGKIVENYKACDTPASECCGGCEFNKNICPECNGTGEVDYDEEMYEELQIFKNQWNLSNDELIKILQDEEI